MTTKKAPARNQRAASRSSAPARAAPASRAPAVKRRHASPVGEGAARRVGGNVTPASRRKKAVSSRRSADPTLWERIAAIGARIPPDELARFPRDGARNVDHYLYGGPREEN